MKINVKIHSKSIGIGIKLEPVLLMSKKIILYRKCLQVEKKDISANSTVKKKHCDDHSSSFEYFTQFSTVIVINM